MAVSARISRKTHIKLPNSLSGPTKVKVGFVRGMADQDNINKAVWNEFGTAGGASGGGWGGPIPERPFLRNAMRNNASKYRNAMASSAEKILLGQATLDSVLTKLGTLAEQDVKNEITSLRSPPNSPVTIEMKGSDNPLIDTGEMRNAVRYKVEP